MHYLSTENKAYSNMCSRIGVLQKIDFFLKTADFSVIVNISVKIKFDVM